MRISKIFVGVLCLSLLFSGCSKSGDTLESIDTSGSSEISGNSSTASSTDLIAAPPPAPNASANRPTRPVTATAVLADGNIKTEGDGLNTDGNTFISNLFYCVREHSLELIEKLRYVLNCREDFDPVKHIISEKAEIGDVQRAAEFYQLIRYSYASGCDSFGGKPHSMWSNFPLIEQASRRLQKVIIENKDFEKLISAQDSEMSFFYCDPPYFSTESYYSNVGFTSADHERLRDSLRLKSQYNCTNCF